MSNTSHEHHPSYSLRSQVENEDQHSVRGAQLLLAGTTLQQYCAAAQEEDDEGEDGPDVIDVKHLTSLAFVSCSRFSPSKKQVNVKAVTRLFPAEASDKDKKKKRRKSGVTEEAKAKNEDEPLPIDILVDTIIGFLEKGTAFLRTVANQSFSLLSARLRRNTIELILTVGNPIP